MSKVPHGAQTAARLAAVQALYQMEWSGAGVDAVINEFVEHRLESDIDGAVFHRADADLFAEIVRGVVARQRRIDPYIERRLAKGWTLSRIEATARAILRAGLFELTAKPETPFRVVINEYLDIANAFFDGDEPRFINGVLDAAAREVRADEFNSPARP